jgi:hypothetical protein
MSSLHRYRRGTTLSLISLTQTNKINHLSHASPLQVSKMGLEGTRFDLCAAKDLLNSSGLPPSVQQHAQQLLTCISQTGNLGSCADQPKTAREQEVLGVIGALKADAQSDAMIELDAAGGGSLRNIISLSKANFANDWPKVSFDGGVELYKGAAKIVLNIFLPGVLTTLPGQNVGVAPIVDAIIEARADALAKVTAAAANHDLGGVVEGVAEAYMSDSAVASCAILNEVSTDLKAAVCGPIGDIIHSIARGRPNNRRRCKRYHASAEYSRPHIQSA